MADAKAQADDTPRPLGATPAAADTDTVFDIAEASGDTLQPDDPRLLALAAAALESGETLAADALGPSTRALPTADVDSAETLAADDARLGALLAASTQDSDETFAADVGPAAAAQPSLASAPSSPGDEEAFDPASLPSVGDRIGEDFEIVRVLGAGGMGTVYLGRDLRLGRRVAIKVMRLGGRDAAARAKLAALFLAEARATARLNHPNVVTIHQVGEHHGLPYLVLELLDGEPLDARLGREPPSLAEALAWLADICRALIHAHGQGLVHRDLKPANVFLTEDGQLKVVDFGLARFDPQRVERKDKRSGTMSDALAGGESPGSISGSPAYMAPEQWRGQPQDERTDLWACGVILYQLVTGALPFEAPLGALTTTETPLPSARVRGLPRALDAVVERCLQRAPAARFATARELLDAVLALASASRRGVQGEPYRYLEPFSEADAGWFFGRDRESAQLAHMATARALVAIVGPSGAGKSSLARAGLLGRLRLQDERWACAAMVPGRTPLQALRTRLEAMAPASFAALGGADVDLRQRPGFVGEVLRREAATTGQRLMLLVDQLEELFTLDQGAAERDAFAAALLSAADDAAVPVRVVVTMRDDFLSALAATPALRDAVVGNLLALGAPDATALQRALEGPARELGFAFEPGLAEAMVAELRAEAQPLPLLQFAASRLWEARDAERHLLTAAALEEMGGVSGLLASHAESILAGMDGDDVQRARVVLCGLVTPSGTRRAMPPAELAARCDDAAAALRVIDRLVQGRLLAVLRSERDVQVQLAHESLIERWERLHAWLGDDADRRVLRERIAEATRHWLDAGRPREMLWGGEPLARAVSFDAAMLGLNVDERAFLDTSCSAQRRSQRRRRALLAGAATVALLVLIASWAAAIALSRAAGEARKAELAAHEAAGTAKLAEAKALVEAQRAHDARRDGFARVLGAWADSRLAVDPMSALLLAREALALRPVAPAIEALHRALVASLQRGVRHHDRPLTHARWLADGRLLTADRAGVVRVAAGVGAAPVGSKAAAATELRGSLGAAPTAVVAWPADEAAAAATLACLGDEDGGVYRVGGGQLERLAALGAPVLALAVAPGGRIAAGMGGGDGGDGGAATGVVAFFGVGAGGTVRRGNERHRGGVQDAIWLPGPARFVSAGADGRALRWTADGGFDGVLARHGDAIAALARDGSGDVVACASLDGSASLHRNGREVARMRGHDGWVTAVAVRADGEQVATGSNDESVRLYRGDGTFLVRVDVHDYGISALRFAPSGPRLLSVSLDGSAALLGPDGKVQARLVGHEQPLTDGDWRADGEAIATASEDGTARVWASLGDAGPRLAGDACAAGRLALSADGTRALVFGEGDLFESCPAGEARLFALPAAGGAAGRVAEVGAGLGVVTAAAFVGAQAVVGDDRGAVRVVDAAGVMLHQLTLPAAVTALVADGDGMWAVATDGAALRLDAAGREVAAGRLAAIGALRAAAACGDGLLRAGADGRVVRVGSGGAEGAEARVEHLSAIACGPGGAYIGDDKGALHALRGGGATQLAAGPGPLLALALLPAAGADDPAIVAASAGGWCSGYSARGALRWRHRLAGGAPAPLVVDAIEGLVFGLDAAGALVALRHDGAPFATLHAPSGPATGLAWATASGEVALLSRGQGAVVLPLRLEALAGRAEARQGRALTAAERAQFGLDAEAQAP